MPVPNSAPQQTPIAQSPLRRVVARHPVAAFLVMAFVFAWTIMLPLLLSQSGFGVLPFALPWQVFGSLMSVFGLALPAFLVTAAKDGEAGVRDLLGRVFRWRVGVHWYLIALFGLLALTLLGAIPFLGGAPLEALAQNWALLFTVYLWGVLVPFVFVNLWEETAWTGFMQHTLQERRGPLVASILIAPAFVVQHLPILLMDAGAGLGSVIIVCALMIVAVFFRIVVMWLYNGSGCSVLVVALFHSAFNSAWGTGDHKFTGELISGPAALLIPIAVVAGIAVVVAALTRGRLSYQPVRGSQFLDANRKAAAHTEATADASKKG